MTLASAWLRQRRSRASEWGCVITSRDRIRRTALIWPAPAEFEHPSGGTGGYADELLAHMSELPLSKEVRSGGDNLRQERRRSRNVIL